MDAFTSTEENELTYTIVKKSTVKTHLIHISDTAYGLGRRTDSDSQSHFSVTFANKTSDVCGSEFFRCFDRKSCVGVRVRPFSQSLN